MPGKLTLSVSVSVIELTLIESVSPHCGLFEFWKLADNQQAWHVKKTHECHSGRSEMHVWPDTHGWQLIELWCLGAGRACANDGSKVEPGASGTLTVLERHFLYAP